MNTNFHHTHADSQAFLNCEETFQLTHGDFFSINNMSDKELREAILNDLILITMWEKQHNQKLHFGFTKMFRFLPRDLHDRVRKQMKHDEICELIQITHLKHGTEIRIKDNHQILQAAMDYSGVWFDGFEMPDDIPIICVDHQKIEKMGGHEVVVETLTTKIMASIMDEKSNAPSNNTLN